MDIRLGLYQHADGGLALESELELANAKAESANSNVDLVVVGERPILNTSGIYLLIQSADGNQPTMAIGLQ